MQGLENDPRQVGETWWSDYWKQPYRVLGFTEHPVWGRQVTCAWADGQVTTHSTPVSARDFRVSGAG